MEAMLMFIEVNSAICSNMDEPGGHYIKWNKPVQKDKDAWYHLQEKSEIVELIEPASRRVVTRGWGEEDMGRY